VILHDRAAGSARPPATQPSANTSSSWRTDSAGKPSAWCAASLPLSWSAAGASDQVAVDDGNLHTHLDAALGDTELDLVVDSIGGAPTRQLAHHLRFGGTLVTYAVLSGQTDSVDILDLIGRQVSWTGFWEINWLRHTDPTLVQAAYRDVVDLIADGTLSARIGRTVPLKDWQTAIELSDTAGGREGKILFSFD